MPMTLTRKLYQGVRINDIRIHVTRIGKSNVRLSIMAPDGSEISRIEADGTDSPRGIANSSGTANGCDNGGIPADTSNKAGNEAVE